MFQRIGNSAFEFLEKRFTEKSPDVPYFLKADLRLDAVRSDPLFQVLVSRVGLPQRGGTITI
jgi:hypothetical protein